MNFNKKIIKGAVVTAATVTVLTTAGMHIASAAENKNVYNASLSNPVIQVADATAATSTSSNSADAAGYKDETVYVLTDATGASKKIIVSDWLKNANKSNALTDFSSLLDIKNVKGYETFETLNGNQLQWNADGKDIYYQGNSEEKTPVEIKVTYTLDGKEVKPEELLGKSGSLKVRYDYSNQLKEMIKINGKNEEIYTPFMMVTGCILPSENFTNVEVTNGKIISDGNKQIVVGLTLPGLSESLKLNSDSITIPDYFEYTADVTDFSIGNSVSVGLTDILSDISLDGDESIDDLQKSLDDLTDATEQLIDGSGKLYDGVKKLQDKTGDFSSGINTLVDGLKSFQDGLKSVANGATDLNKGAKTLKGGTDTLVDGLSAAKGGADKLVSNYANLKAGANKIYGGLTSAEGGIASLKGGIDQTNKTYETLSQTVSNDEQIIAALKQINAGYKDENIAAVIAKLEANTAGQKKISAGLSGAGKKLAAGANEISVGTTALAEGMGSVVNGIGALDTGSQQLQGALGQLYAGGKKLQSGAGQLYSGTGTLVQGANKLHAASSDLMTGGNKLLDGSKKLTDGVNELADGAHDLNDGIIKYNDEGISKITDVADGDIQSFIDRFNAISKKSSEYKTFTNLGDDMDGNVKFIIKMDGIEE